MNPHCRIELLGGLRVYQEERLITRFQTQKTAALLAYIALHKGRSFPREFIAELLWPDGDPTAIRNRLNQAVSSLRRQLHPPGSDPGYVIDADHSKISINPKTITTDVEDFFAAIKRAQDCETEEDEMPALEAAVAAYGGDFLDGYYEEWALLERVRLADQYTHALSRLIRLYADRGRLSDAIEVASKRLALDPLEERNHRALMRLYVMAARPQSALSQFDELDRALASDGRTPSPKALKLLESAKEALAGAGPVDQPLPTEVTVTEAEEPPEHVRPTKKVTIEPSSTLPLYVTNFVGRTEELADIIKAIRGGHRLVTLTGLGGMGKTRLAVEAAWRLEPDFAGNVVFVSIQGMTKFEEIYPQISRAIRRIYGLNPDLNVEITEDVPRIGRLLVVVDNVEVVDDETIAWFNDRLGRYHQMSVIMTARTQIGLDGEYMVPIGPLPVPDMQATTTLQDLAENPAISLFVSRARIARHDFQITERTAGAIVRLCRRLEGWPLALELAAGWSRTLTPAQMVEQVAQQYDRLASRRRDIAERHRSMGAVLDGSFDILEGPLRDTLMHLVVFEGGFEHEAAEHVCPDVDILAVLQELEERNWVKSSFSEGRVRFWMLQTLRSYLNQRVSNAQKIEAAWLHAAYYAKLVQDIGGRDREEWGTITSDHANIRAAFDFYVSQGASKEAVTMLIYFAPMLDMAGSTNDAVTCFDRVVPFLDELSKDEPKIVARARAVFGRKLLVYRETERARPQLIAARDSLAALGDTEGNLSVRIDLANVSHVEGDYDESIAAFAAIEKEALEAGLESAASRAATGQANGLLNLHRLEEAHAALERAVASARKASDSVRLSTALQSMAAYALQKGDLERAEEALTTALAITEQLGHRQLWAYAQTGLTQVERRRGDWRAAAERLYLVLRTTVSQSPAIAGILLETVFVFEHFRLDGAAAQIAGCMTAHPSTNALWHEEVETSGLDSVAKLMAERSPTVWQRETDAGARLTMREVQANTTRELKALLEAF